MMRTRGRMVTSEAREGGRERFKPQEELERTEEGGG
jgi:hypothetical protein